MTDWKKAVECIDELINEAEKEPSWKAIQALRCLRKELLEKQEPTIPVFGYSIFNVACQWRCGACDGNISRRDNYCRNCGRLVNWE